MNGISKQAVATSPLIRFIIGSEKHIFTAHAALVAHHSPQLSSLVQTVLRDNPERCVTWLDIQPEVFTSLWQYFYTQDYDAPCAVLPKNISPPPQGPHIKEEPLDQAPIVHLEIRKKRKLTKRRSLWKDFRSSWRVDLPQVDRDGPVTGDSAVLIHHARVYMLGQRCYMDKLMSLSLHKLHYLLAHPSTTGLAVDDVVPLIRHCFVEGASDVLKKFVLHYATCKIEKLYRIEAFREFLRESGELSRGLVEAMMARLD